MFKRIICLLLISALMCMGICNSVYADELENETESETIITEQLDVMLEQVTPDNPYVHSNVITTEDGRTITALIEIEDVTDQYGVSPAHYEEDSTNTTLATGRTYTFRASYTFDVSAAYSYVVVLRKNSSTNLEVIETSRYAQPSPGSAVVDCPELDVDQLYSWEVNVSGYVTMEVDQVLVVRRTNYYVNMAACISTQNDTLAITNTFSY
ncbi:MAG: hypothetical protein E7192_00520 [Erysipelotrichaceae bacterium]|nr:hypothetical protein [Erysipelotrichaceae bacterium]